MQKLRLRKSSYITIFIGLNQLNYLHISEFDDNDISIIDRILNPNNLIELSITQNDVSFNKDGIVKNFLRYFKATPSKKVNKFLGLF